MDADRFSNIILPLTERDMSLRLVTRPVERVSGETEWITMSSWHWYILDDWVIKGCHKTGRDFFEHAERYLKPTGFAHTLEWLLEGEYDFIIEQRAEQAEALENSNEFKEDA